MLGARCGQECPRSSDALAKAAVLLHDQAFSNLLKNVKDENMITEIAFTGTPVTDIKRARAFYEGGMGFKPTMESAGGMWVEYDIAPGRFGIGCYGDVWKPSPEGTYVPFEVAGVDAER